MSKKRLEDLDRLEAGVDALYGMVNEASTRDALPAALRPKTELGEWDGVYRALSLLRRELEARRMVARHQATVSLRASRFFSPGRRR